ncbi:oxidoreductase [Gordonia sihwensis]|uniref:benzoate 1,2-dioxygenase electron transfer component BenC n=2 Tax=Gordonia sihwensis TaxID=173559 RepID=UPI001C93190F|nr:benzoate 1,2-dioxygenase electron transfer component BenC [Gordonia sihwensis]MBY4568976.1 oxidoreductase [Gordonia sihwensis]
MTVTSGPASGRTAAPAEAPTHRVALAFEDGVTKFIDCREDQTVADASYRQRINIPLDCRDGACGTCKALCESGDYDGGTYIDDALSPAESADGYALPCCMKPRSDLVLQIAATSDVAKTQAAEFSATVVGLERLSPTTMRLSVEIPNRSELAFLPGQYVNIDVPGTDDGSGSPVRRSYSFANGPHEDTLVFLVKLTPGGAMSTYLTDRASTGDLLTLRGPHGSFFLRESMRPALLLAGGTGLAPILAILRKLRHDGSARRIHLIYGVSTDDDLVETETLDRMQSEVAGFTWDHCVSDPGSSAANKGYVTSLIAPRHLYGGDVATYLCGPPPMVESVRRHFVEAGIELTGFYYEKFALAAGPSPAEPVTDAVAASASANAEAPVDVPIAPALDARAVAGQPVLPAISLPGLEPRSAPGADESRARIVGQRIWPEPTAAEPSALLDADTGVLEPGAARSIAGQEVFPGSAAAAVADVDVAAESVATQPGTTADEPASIAPAEVPTVGSEGYEIGEEHPEIHESDALFEARAALELDALELMIGRMTSQQLAGYRLLAEATVPYVDGDRFVDSAEYTATNAAFHDYLFHVTGNTHLLEAYTALGVKGRMSEVLRTATWCHPLCTQDHLDIVAAFEAGDRDTARALISAHGERSKQTMRRAMADELAARKPRFVTPGRFAGKVVVVTGAGQGIGEATARRISAEGGRVVVADRSEYARTVASDLSASGPGAIAVNADLESYARAAEVIDRALAAYGRVDVLVNNVGGAINFKPFTEFTDEEIRAEVDRSLMTTLYACRAVLPTMVERGGGVIVNVSSAATRGIHRIPYSAAKGGVNAITASLAMEYAPAGVRVVATAPGGTDAPPRRVSRGTPVPADDTQREWFQAHIDQTLDASLMNRYGTLDEQAAAICFLASDEASYITGSVLPVAGGDQG